MHPETERLVRGGLRPFRLLWGAATAAALALAGLGAALVGIDLPAASPAPPLALAFAAAGALAGVATLVIDRRVLGPDSLAARVRVPDVELVMRHLLAGHLVLWSWAQLPAILGFAQLVLGGGVRTHLLLCAVSVTSLALLMPAEARIASRVERVLQGVS